MFFLLIEDGNLNLICEGKKEKDAKILQNDIEFQSHSSTACIIGEKKMMVWKETKKLSFMAFD